MALHTMALLASNPEKSMSVRKIATTFEVSEAHLSKVLQRLSRAGLVKSTRGPVGGFTLAKNDDEITLRDIFEVIEGTLEPRSCLLGSSTCRGGICILGDIWAIDNQIIDYFSRTYLSQVCNMNINAVNKE